MIMEENFTKTSSLRTVIRIESHTTFQHQGHHDETELNERKTKTLEDMARPLIWKNDLPKSLWVGLLKL